MLKKIMLGFFIIFLSHNSFAYDEFRVENYFQNTYPVIYTKNSENYNSVLNELKNIDQSDIDLLKDNLFVYELFKYVDLNSDKDVKNLKKFYFKTNLCTIKKLGKKSIEINNYLINEIKSNNNNAIFFSNFHYLINDKFYAQISKFINEKLSTKDDLDSFCSI